MSGRMIKRLTADNRRNLDKSNEVSSTLSPIADLSSAFLAYNPQSKIPITKREVVRFFFQSEIKRAKMNDYRAIAGIAVSEPENFVN